jgi:hypothetical protein
MRPSQPNFALANEMVICDRCSTFRGISGFTRTGSRRASLRRPSPSVRRRFPNSLLASASTGLRWRSQISVDYHQNRFVRDGHSQLFPPRGSLIQLKSHSSVAFRTISSSTNIVSRCLWDQASGNASLCCMPQHWGRVWLQDRHGSLEPTAPSDGDRGPLIFSPSWRQFQRSEGKLCACFPHWGGKNMRSVQDSLGPVDHAGDR